MTAPTHFADCPGCDLPGDLFTVVDPVSREEIRACGWECAHSQGWQPPAEVWDAADRAFLAAAEETAARAPTYEQRFGPVKQPSALHAFASAILDGETPTEAQERVRAHLGET